jgi:hypothetical protein
LAGIRLQNSAAGFVGEFVMPSKRQARAIRKNAQRSAAAGRERHMFNLKRKRKPLLSMDVLKALAASNLPADPVAYTAKLKKLLESA